MNTRYNHSNVADGLSEMSEMNGLWETIDQWRARRQVIGGGTHALIAILMLGVSSFGFTARAHADEVSEFNEGSDGWSAYPSTMGRSSESGWVNVTNDGEGSIRNNPTGTRYTYYWKLNRDLDLTGLDAPTLEVKLHFKGHSYDYVRVQIGEEGARRLSDFTTLHESSVATAEPEELSLDLSDYAGQRVKIQVILRKPYDVVERRIGLYVHRIALITPAIPLEVNDTPNELRVSAFNVQVFGRSKMDKPDVVASLTQIMMRFDLVMIQEVRDSSEVAIVELLDELNALSPAPYALHLSARAGRTTSKEQIAFLYRADKLNLLDSGETPDPDDRFERPPAWVELEHLESGEVVHVIGAHLSPSAVPVEIAELYDVYLEHSASAPEGESTIVMGDFNAGCRYLNDDETANAELFNEVSLSSLIGDDVDTTTTSTFCPYDRILVGGYLSEQVQESGVYAFDQDLGLTSDQARAVSDHYPVWARFQLGAE